MSGLDTNGLLPLETPSTPGLDLNANQGPKIIAVCAVLIAISTIAVILRFVARMLSKAGLWWDDWVILAALLVSWGGNICMIYAAGFGFGKHMDALGTLEDRLEISFHWFKLFYIFETIYTVAIVLVKYSILLFYSRIFKEYYFKVALWFTTGLVTAWFIAIETSVIVECQPIHALWDFTPGHCINLSAFFLGSGIPNIILNTVIVILPLPMVWTLAIDRSYKLALSGIFLLGGFIIVVSIVRVIILAGLQEVDITWEFVDAAIWTSVEPAIGVVSACLPIMRSLWIRSRHSSSPRNSIESKRSTNPSIKSIGVQAPRGTKERTGSFTSHTPLNELSAEGELPWAKQVPVNSKNRNSKTTSKHTSNYTSETGDIALDDFTSHKGKISESEEKQFYKGGNIWKHIKKRSSDPAELYG